MDATLVTAWTAICQQVSSAFTAPTVITFLHIATGWVLCRSKPTVTSLISTIGRSLLRHTAKHWTTYERFFYRARWSLPHVSRLLLVRVVAPLVESLGVERVIDLNIDDTTCGRCGTAASLSSGTAPPTTASAANSASRASPNRAPSKRTPNQATATSPAT